MEKQFSAESSTQGTRIEQYVVSTFSPEDSVLRAVRERSKRESMPQIHVGNMDGLHLEVLARATGAKKAVEIGTLAGYSGICLLRGMGPQGKLITLEADHRFADIASESFKSAGLGNQVEIIKGFAMENLPKISHRGPFDLVFIDADKENYPNYLNWAAENLRIGGVVIGDNTLAFGMIADENFEDPEDEAAVKAIRKFNCIAAQSGRFRSTLLPTGEGLTFAVKIR